MSKPVQRSFELKIVTSGKDKQSSCILNVNYKAPSSDKKYIVSADRIIAFEKILGELIYYRGPVHEIIFNELKELLELMDVELLDVRGSHVESIIPKGEIKT